jgi:hypothetical protein
LDLVTERIYHIPGILSSKEEQLLIQYKSKVRIPVDRMRKSTDMLSNGEKDVLNMVRDALTWPTSLSLAYKYYPLYPHRKWWLEALRRAQKWARFVNIRYLLMALRSIKQEKETDQERTMRGVSIDTTYNKDKVYQLIQANEERIEARRITRIVLAAEGGDVR